MSVGVITNRLADHTARGRPGHGARRTRPCVLCGHQRSQSLIILLINLSRPLIS